MRFKFKTNDFDEKSLEILFLHIDRYKIFRDLTLCLNSQYEVSKNGETFEVIKKGRFDPYREMGINLNIFCGKNGSGKSSVLEILSGRDSAGCEKATFLAIDKNGSIISTHNIPVKLNGEQIDWIEFSPAEGYSIKTEADAKGIFQEGITNAFYRNFTGDYVDNPGLYDFENDAAVNFFEIRLWSFNELQSDLKLHLLRTTQWVDAPFWDINFEKSPLTVLFHILAQDITFHDYLAKIGSSFNSKNSNDFVLLSARYPFKDFQDEYNNIDKLMKEVLFVRGKSGSQKFKQHKIKDFNAIREKIIAIDERIKSLFERISKFRFHVPETPLLDYIYFRAGKKYKDKSTRFLSDLSDGEFVRLKTIYSIFPCMSQSSAMFITEDEPDNHLHPEWKRHFLKIYTDAMCQVRSHLESLYKEKEDKDNIRKKIFSVVISTHSPFLLSDVFSEHVTILEKTDISTAARKLTRSPFAGNIGEMFYTSFFMTETIGELAKKLVLEASENFNEMSDEKMARAEQIIENIGDDNLKSLLLKKVSAYRKQMMDT